MTDGWRMRRSEELVLLALSTHRKSDATPVRKALSCLS